MKKSSRNYKKRVLTKKNKLNIHKKKNSKKSSFKGGGKRKPPKTFKSNECKEMGICKEKCKRFFKTQINCYGLNVFYNCLKRHYFDPKLSKKYEATCKKIECIIDKNGKCKYSPT